MIDYRKQVSCEFSAVLWKYFGLPICVLALSAGLALLSVPRSQAAWEPVEARKPPGIEVLFYNKGIMERVYRNRTNPAFARTGDYVRGMRLRPSVDCLLAVNWQSRWMLAANAVLVIDFYDPVQRRYERHRCQAVDHQMRKHSTSSRQRFEIDWKTAKAVNAVPNNTTAILIRVEE